MDILADLRIGISFAAASMILNSSLEKPVVQSTIPIPSLFAKSSSSIRFLGDEKSMMTSAFTLHCRKLW
jgi:hypothetical protein